MLQNHSGLVDVVVNLVGYVHFTTCTAYAGHWGGHAYFPIDATRVASGSVPARGHLVAKVAGGAAVPAGAKAVLVNVTAEISWYSVSE